MEAIRAISPESGDFVLDDLSVATHKSEIFYPSLSDEQAIKRISVPQRKQSQFRKVTPSDRQPTES